MVEDLPTLKALIDWQQQSVRVFGKIHPQPRLTCWYGPTSYLYSGLTLPARELPTWLEPLRRRCEQLAGEKFNSVMCNLYRDGRDSVGWHADDEPIFRQSHAIASLSLGGTRRFLMKRRTGEDRQAFELAHGDVIVMARGMQRDWLHCVPKTKRHVAERINLTFRSAAA